MAAFWIPTLELCDVENGSSKYERLCDHISAEIAAGRLVAGTMLAPEQRMATELKVARSTVRNAMAALEDRGLISRIHGRGTFVREGVTSRMRRGQDLLALILPETDQGFYPRLLREFESAGRRDHNQTLICNTGNDVHRQGNLILQLIDHRVGGVAMVPTTVAPTSPYQIRQLQQHDIPVVFCARRVEGISAPLLQIPFEHIGRVAGRMFLQSGHEHIAYLAGMRSEASLAYERGMRTALEEAGHDPRHLVIGYGNAASPGFAVHDELVRQFLQSVFQRPEKPTAIFASFDSIAESIDLQLSAMGIRVPEDVAVVGFGGGTRNSAMSNRLTSVTVDESFIGRRAAEILEELRNGVRPLNSTETFNVPVHYHLGETVAGLSGEGLLDGLEVVAPTPELRLEVN